MNKIRAEKQLFWITRDCGLILIKQEGLTAKCGALTAGWLVAANWVTRGSTICAVHHAAWWTSWRSAVAQVHGSMVDRLHMEQVWSNLSRAKQIWRRWWVCGWFTVAAQWLRRLSVAAGEAARRWTPVRRLRPSQPKPNTQKWSTGYHKLARVPKREPGLRRGGVPRWRHERWRRVLAATSS